MLGGLKVFARAERATRAHRRRPALLLRGMLSQRRDFYPLDEYPLEFFLSDWEIETKLAKINSPFSRSVLSDKLFLAWFIGSLAEPPRTSAVVGVVDEGKFHGVGRQDLEAAIERSGRVFAKPVAGAGGRGVVVATRPADIPRTGTFIVETPLQQARYAAAIFPAAANTVRLYVGQHASVGGAFVVGAVHRFGTRTSVPVDNLSRGGLVAHVDLESGRLSAARGGRPPYLDAPLATHPETGAAIAGTAVPHWPEVQAVALRLTRALPGLRFVGWDFCMTDAGPVLVEGNAYLANPNLIQAHRPLLLDERVRHLLLACGVISRRRHRRLGALAPRPAGAAGQARERRPS